MYSVTDRLEFVEEVREFLEREGVSVTAFADMCDMSNPAVYKWLSGSGFPLGTSMEKVRRVMEECKSGPVVEESKGAAEEMDRTAEILGKIFEKVNDTNRLLRKSMNVPLPKSGEVRKLTKYSELKHGMRVRCKIDGVQVDDAKLSVDADGQVYVCQDVADGADAEDKLGYEYSWCLGFKGRNIGRWTSMVTDLVAVE